MKLLTQGRFCPRTMEGHAVRRATVKTLVGLSKSGCTVAGSDESDATSFWPRLTSPVFSCSQARLFTPSGNALLKFIASNQSDLQVTSEPGALAMPLSLFRGGLALHSQGSKLRRLLE